ncbi:MAG: type II toxin-antitoxin system VapC family toxin, partial [Blastocatellia bacterium]
MRITIDASVFVAAARPAEPHYLESRAFILEAQKTNAEVICPTLVLPECGAAIARRTGNPTLALSVVVMIDGWWGLQLIQLMASRARRAAQIAADQRLRGADSVYVAIAEEFASTLVTWDGEMLQRGAALVTT